MQENDFHWFLDHYAELFEKYGRGFLAIKNQSVLGVYSTYADGVRETEKKESRGTYIIQKCTGDESAYTNYIASFDFS